MSYHTEYTFFHKAYRLLHFFTIAGLLYSAQLMAAPALDIEADFSRTSIVPYIDFYEDLASGYSLAHISSDEVSTRFTPHHQKTLSFGYRKSTLWFRFVINNTSDTHKSLLLELKGNGIEEIELFKPTAHINNADEHLPVKQEIEPPYQSTSTGASQPYDSREAKHPEFLFDLELQPGATHTYYLRLKSGSPINFDLNLSSGIGYAEYSHHTEWFHGFFIGMLIVLIIYHMFLYIDNRDTLYISYSLLLASMIIYDLAFFGELASLFPNESGVQEKLLDMATALSNTIIIFFILNLIPKRQLNFLPKILLYFAFTLNCVAFFFIPFLSNAIGINIIIALASVTAPILLIGGISAYLNGFTLIIYFLIGTLFNIGTTALIIIATFGAWEYPLIATFSLTISTSVNAFLLALILYLNSRNKSQLHLKKELNYAQEHANLLAKSEFVARMAHQIRKPTTETLGLTNLLLDGSLSEDQRDNIRTIQRTNNNLLNIISEALDISKIQTGKIELNTIPFDLHTLVNECIDIFMAKSDTQHIELINDIQYDIPSAVEGDPTRLRQVLINLLSNAFKFTDRGEIVVSVSKENDNVIKFTVSDTGKGISQADQHELRQALNNETGVSSLGLVVNKQLVELMGGDFSFNSGLGKGSQFSFTVKLPKSESFNTDDTHYADETLRGLNVLVVDDCATSRKIIAKRSQGWGMKVASAVDGREALAALHTRITLNEPFDIVILDHDMPKMNGLQLAEKIQDDPLITNDILLIMMTGLSIAPSNKATTNIGIRKVLTKPITGNLLKSTLIHEFEKKSSKPSRN